MTSPTKPTTDGPSGRGVSFGLAATILAIPTGVVFIDRGLATILASAELTLLLTVLLTAVFAPATISERAFRLLRWMTGHPEPTQPPNTTRSQTPTNDLPRDQTRSDSRA